MWKTCGQTPASPSGEEGRRTLWEGSTVGQTVALQESLREGGPGGQVAGGRMGSPCVRGAGCGRTRAQSPSPARGQRGQRPPATFAITEPSPGAWVLLSPPAQPEETDGLGSLTQTRLGVTSPAESRARPAAQKSWGWRWNSAHTSLRV